MLGGSEKGSPTGKSVGRVSGGRSPQESVGRVSEGGSSPQEKQMGQLVSSGADRVRQTFTVAER